MYKIYYLFLLLKPVYVVSMVLIYMESTRFMCVIGSCMSLYFRCTCVFLCSRRHLFCCFQNCIHPSAARVSLFFISIIIHCKYYAFLSQPILHMPCWENNETFFKWWKFFPPSSAVFCLQIICVCWTNFFESPNHLELLLFPIQSGLVHWNLDVFHMKSHQDHTTPFPNLTPYAKINVLADIFKFLFLIIIPPIDVYQIKARLLQR